MKNITLKIMYKKIQILLAISLFIFPISGCFDEKTQNSAATIGIAGNHLKLNEIKELDKKINTKIRILESNEKIKINPFEFNVGGYQKLVIYLANKEIDILIINEEKLEKFRNQDIFDSVENHINNRDIKIDNNIIEIDNDLSKDEKLYLCIIKNGENRKYISEIMKILLNYKGENNEI